MGKHTPGLWMAERFCEDEEGCGVIAVHEEIGLRSPTRGLVAWCGITAGAAFESPGRAEANARLIASAPTMYEFVQLEAQAGNSAAKTILEAIHGRS